MKIFQNQEIHFLCIDNYLISLEARQIFDIYFFRMEIFAFKHIYVLTFDGASSNCIRELSSFPKSIQ